MQTNWFQKSFLESQSCSAGQEIRLSWTVKIYYCVHKSPPFTYTYAPQVVSSLQVLQLKFSMHSPPGFPTKILTTFLIFHVHAMLSHPSHPPWFGHPHNILWRVQIMKFHIMQYSPSYVWIFSLHVQLLFLQASEEGTQRGCWVLSDVQV